MPIEVYELNDTGQHVPVASGDTPAPASARDGADSGVPGAPPETPATSQEDAGAPPAPPSPSSLGEDEGDESDDAQAVTMDDFNRHMARMRQRQRRAERARESERTQYQQELAGLRGQLDVMTRLMQGQSPDLGTAQQPAGPPQAEQYQDHDAYITAKARYEAQQVLEQQRQQTQQAQQQQALMDREVAFKAAHPDFDHLVNTNLRGKVAPHVQQALMLLPDGPELAYALAQQPDALAQLNQLPPPQMLLALGRLSPAPAPAPPATTTTTTTNGVAPTTPAPTPLPPPMQPVNGQGSVPTGTFREDMDQSEYRQWRTRTSGLDKWQKRRG